MSEPESYPVKSQNIDIYGTAISLFAARAPDEKLRDPSSPVAQAFEVATKGFIHNGVDIKRLQVGFALANIDLFNNAKNIRRISPEDFYGQS